MGFVELYGDIALLAGRLRFSVRQHSHDSNLFDGGRTAWTVGIADLNGLLYWLVRLLR